MRKQLSLWEGGENLKLNGQETVEMNNQEFVNLMRVHAVETANRHGKVSSDDLRRYARVLGVHPSHPNAWGSIFNGKRWKVVGRIRSQLTSNHAREIREWGIA